MSLAELPEYAFYYASTLHTATWGRRPCKKRYVGAHRLGTTARGACVACVACVPAHTRA